MLGIFKITYMGMQCLPKLGPSSMTGNMSNNFIFDLILKGLSYVSALMMLFMGLKATALSVFLRFFGPRESKWITTRVGNFQN